MLPNLVADHDEIPLATLQVRAGRTQLEELLAVGADAVLLDNLGRDDLRTAVERVDGRLLTEASGGITPQSARPIAECGVDLLSIAVQHEMDHLLGKVFVEYLSPLKRDRIKTKMIKKTRDEQKR